AADAAPASHIQVGIFAVPENSAALIGRLAAAGIPAQARPLTRQDRVLTRVVAGPFGSEAERDRALGVIEDLGIRDARLTRE
ncbi:MAG: SPOR domain-containing protein, partial [Thermohalobaculum sp.]|nr:SPOR domain-containing protein [Thermohalobaculum sp.]